MTVNYTYMLPAKAQDLKNKMEAPFPKKDSLLVEEYENAAILPIKKFAGDAYALGRGGVISAEGHYVESSALNQRIYGSYDAECAYLNKNVVFCGWYVNHWGHFLVDTVIRLWYRPENVDGFAFIVNEGEQLSIEGNFKRFFELLGIPLDKVILINRATRFNKVIVPQSSYSRSDYYSEEYIGIFDTVREAALEYTGSGEAWERIFFSRAGLLKAKLHDFNSAEIDSFFKINGFQIISPEKMALDDMIFHLNNCKLFAAISGTLPHNLLFSQNGKEAIIAERNVINNEIQVDVNRIKELNVTYVDVGVGVFPVDVSAGPFLLGFTKEMKEFASEHCMRSVRSKLNSPFKFRRLLKLYLNDYFYLEKEYPPEWIAHDNSELIKEAYDYSQKRYCFLSLRHRLQNATVRSINKR